MGHIPVIMIFLVIIIILIPTTRWFIIDGSAALSIFLLLQFEIVYVTVEKPLVTIDNREYRFTVV